MNKTVPCDTKLKDFTLYMIIGKTVGIRKTEATKCLFYSNISQLWLCILRRILNDYQDILPGGPTVCICFRKMFT